MINTLFPAGISAYVPGAAAASFSTVAHCLRLHIPGKGLDLTALLYAMKSRLHGYKKQPKTAFENLKEDSLGTIEPTKCGK